MGARAHAHARTETSSNFIIEAMEKEICSEEFYTKTLLTQPKCCEVWYISSAGSFINITVCLLFHHIIASIGLSLFLLSESYFLFFTHARMRATLYVKRILLTTIRYPSSLRDKNAWVRISCWHCFPRKKLNLLASTLFI